MAASQGWLRVQDAVDEMLRRQGTSPDGGHASPAATHYGRLYAPPPQNMAELRRQQAEFAEVVHDLDRRNSWLAIPALAPVAAALGAETAAILGARGAAAGGPSAPLYLRSREPWPLTRAAKEALWRKSPEVWARAHGLRASELVSREWTAFRQLFKGRQPTPAEVMEAKLRFEKMIAPLVRRPGVSRPNPKPKSPEQ